jgi:prepilin-type N-terminal cleavage/methylation domain-containing protein/prepilin-type processing-associated H-X9-DG protein
MKRWDQLVKATGKTSSGRAFTLVELLVVVAIIGVLAALLFPALSAAKAHANSTTCKNHLRQMVLALQSYAHDHDGKYVYGTNPHDPSLDNAIGPANTRYWWAKLLPYYPLKWTDVAYHCPGYKGAIRGEIDNLGPLGSYAYNELGVSGDTGVSDPARGILYHPGRGFGLGPSTYKDDPRSPVSESQIAEPSDMLAIGESRFLSAQVNYNPGGQDYLLCGRRNWAETMDFTKVFPYTAVRHGKNYNLSYCDGHVSAMVPWVLYNPTNTASMWNYDHQPHPEFWYPDW